MPIERACLQCGNNFYTHLSYIKKGKGKFCSTSCATTYRNLKDNPSKRPEVKMKISLNHADVSGANNPMYGRKGSEAPSWIDGRSYFKGDIWRRIALANKPYKCEVCGIEPGIEKLHIHHKDKNRKNNDLDNLQVVCVLCHNNIIHERQRDNLGRFIKEVV